VQSALVVGIVAVLCVIVAIGARLQGALAFSGPRWVPGVGSLPQPTPRSTPLPQGTATPLQHVPVRSGVVFSWLPIAIILGCLLIAVLALLVLYWLRHRRPRRDKMAMPIDGDFEVMDDLSEIDLDADLPTLHRGLVRASVALEGSREPRDAIVKAWIGLQEAAEDSGLNRRPSETPTEFTTRVFESVNADRSAAATLLAVYLRARFGSAPATASDVIQARDAIERLRQTWPVMTAQ
jgi:hypothetical protein